MDFEITHGFEAAADRVAEVMLDPDYQRSLDGIGPLASRTVLEQSADGSGRVHRRIRCVLGRDLGQAERFLGGGDPAWVEEAHWDPAEMTWRWTIVPEVAQNLLSAHGEIVLEDDGRGSARRVRGTVRVKVPLYGGKVEGIIVSGLEEAYDEEARRLADWLA